MGAAAPVLMATAAAISAVGAIRQGQAQSAAYRYQRDLARQNATIAQQQAASDVTDIRRAGAKALGGIRAAYGASGVTLEGTPMDVLEASTAQVELDALRRSYAGELEAMGFKQQAAGYEMAAKTARQAGYISGASNLLLSGAQAQKAGLFSRKVGTPVKVE
jgi:hypothetical protein